MDPTPSTPTSTLSIVMSSTVLVALIGGAVAVFQLWFKHKKLREEEERRKQEEERKKQGEAREKAAERVRQILQGGKLSFEQIKKQVPGFSDDELREIIRDGGAIEVRLIGSKDNPRPPHEGYKLR
jgi:hypothetical protein